MKIGTYYYPDQWPRSEWERDLDNICKAGLQLIHLAEFSWGTCEPMQDHFEFDWLADILELAKQRGLDAIVCTPTAIVPVWMANQHPDLFWHQHRFGGRRHANHFHPFVQERSHRIATEIARRFGEHPSVIGWQIDNELSTGRDDQSEYMHRAFRAWLRKKYGDIAAVNEAWGCAFWNTYYTDFDQILYPPGKDLWYRNQHQFLDAHRFFSDGYVEYARQQAADIKPFIGDRWITTNFMPFVQDINPADCRDFLSLYSWDTYPISGQGKAFDSERFRLSDASGVGFMHDQMVSFNGRWALMEVQPGQINWSGRPVRLMPGAVRLLLWQALAHSAEFVTVYRWRQPRFGVEMWHDGLVRWDGETLSQGGEEFAQVAADLKKIAPEGNGDYSAFERRDDVPAVGLMHDQEQLYSYTTMPQAARWNQAKLVTQYHAAVEKLGLPVTVVHPVATSAEELAKLPLLIVPGLQIASDELVEKVKTYVRNGGHLIITARSFTLDERGQAPTGLYGHRLFDLIGSTIQGYDSLPDETFGDVQMNGVEHRWGIWADLVTPGPVATVLAKFADQHYADTATVVEHAYGKGKVIFVGPIDEGTLSDAVVLRAADALNLPILDLPPKTRLHRMKGLTIFLNFDVEPVTAPVPEGATLLIGLRDVPAAGVAIWRE